MNRPRGRFVRFATVGVAFVVVGLGAAVAQHWSAAPNSASADQRGQIARPAVEDGQKPVVEPVVEPAEHIFDDVKSCPLAA